MKIHTRQTPFQRFITQFAYTPIGLWLVSRITRPLDHAVVALTGGKHMLITLITGLPACMLTTTGAKSGQPRTTPLVAIPDDPGQPGVILVASNFGGQHSPAWSYNLKAHPEAVLMVKEQSYRCRARELSGADYERCWAKAAAIYPGYETYRRRAHPRHIPVFYLVPLA